MRSILISLSLFAVVACQDKTAPPEQAKPAVKPKTAAAAPPKATSGTEAKPNKPAKNVGNMLGQLAQAAKALQKVGAAGGKASMGPVVNWRALEKFLPAQVGDYKAVGELRGSTAGLAGMQVSSVRRQYKGAAKQTLRISLTDTSLVPMLRAGFRLAQVVTEDSSQGIRKAVQVDGHQAIASWRKGTTKGRVQVLVAGRYVLDVTIRPAKGIEKALALAKQIDLAGISKLKPATPKAAK